MLRRSLQPLVLAFSLLLAACQAPMPMQAPAPEAMTAGFHTEADFGWAATGKGINSDPINIVFIGSRWDVSGVFAAAGWVEPDPITAGNILKQGKALFGKTYTTSPFSNLYYLNRKQDLAYEKNSTDIKKRDHLRLWQSNMKAMDGRPVYMCAASRDIGITLDKNTTTLISHKVEVNRDLERDMVLADLQATGRVDQLIWLPGDPLKLEKPVKVESDGRIALVVLKTSWSLFGW